MLSDDGQMTLQQALAIRKLNAGATWALDCLVADSPIGRALRETFSHSQDFRKILSVAYFIILSGNNNVSRYEEFAEHTRLPWPVAMSPSTIGRLFLRITTRKIEAFLHRMVATRKDDMDDGETGKLMLALDSTSISSYSEKLACVERGRNKDDDDLPQINLLMLVDAQKGFPLYYRYYDGNVPDVSTIRRVIADSARLNLKNIVLVSDKGYSSVRNIDDCLRNHIGFLFNMKCGVRGSVVQQWIDEARGELEDLNNRDWYSRVTQVTKEVSWDYDPYPVANKRSRRDEKARLYCHIYYDRTVAQAVADNLMERIDKVRQKLEQEKALDENEQDLFERVFVKEGDQYQIANRVVQDMVAYKGYRVLLSDEISSARDAWVAYKERWIVEDTFKTMK